MRLSKLFLILILFCGISIGLAQGPKLPVYMISYKEYQNYKTTQLKESLNYHLKGYRWFQQAPDVDNAELVLIVHAVPDYLNDQFVYSCTVTYKPQKERMYLMFATNLVGFAQNNRVSVTAKHLAEEINDIYIKIFVEN